MTSKRGQPGKPVTHWEIKANNHPLLQVSWSGGQEGERPKAVTRKAQSSGPTSA